MRFKTVVDLGRSSWRDSLKRGTAPITLCLLGPPGIGKTSTARTLAAAMTEDMRSRTPDAPPAICEVLDLSSRLPEDIGGLPFRSKAGDVDITIYAVQSWLGRLCQPGAYGVLCLDDLPAAAPAVQVAVRQVVLDRKVGDNHLSDGIFIITTGNRREDKSGASTLPAHFRNSVMILSVEPDLKEWCNWYGSQEGNLSPLIPAFLRWRPTHHSKLPKDADKTGSFATPRTWAMLGQVLDVAEATGTTIEVAAGLVGEGVAVEFKAFCNVRANLVDPNKVFDNPKTALPNPGQLDSPDKLVAMTTALGEIAAKRRQSNDKTKKSEAPVKFLRAIGHVTQKQREYVATAVSTYTANGGDINSLVTAARSNMKDPMISSVIKFLSKTFNGGN